MSWIGTTDLNASQGDPKAGHGPVAQALQGSTFRLAHLLTNFPPERNAEYLKWLAGRTESRIEITPVHLSRPNHYGEIHSHAVAAVEEVRKRFPDAGLTFHLSPGTPPMSTVWVLLAKSRYQAELIDSSAQHGVRKVDIPFEISAEFVPTLLAEPDQRLTDLAQGLAPEAPEFRAIIHKCAGMKRVILKARRAAPRSIPVLIEGEAGTGKELLARAMHVASPRGGKPFIAVNCGAIPAELANSELFGHRKGAFTGAVADHTGCIQAADGGTLFLDEVGELTPAIQVRLLRALQETEVTPVGSNRPIKVDVRVVAATNRNLVEEVAQGRFREDLYHRLAVATLYLPPLRDRHGDLGMLVDALLNQVNVEMGGQPGFQRKKLSPGARALLLRHAWPGNVRELKNTLIRAAIWSSGETVGEAGAREALTPQAKMGETALRPLTEGFDIRRVLSEIATHYLSLAMTEANGNKTAAAKLLGLPSYQTLSNWLKKHGIAD